MICEIMGFSLRKGYKRKRITREVYMREWLCSQEGSQRESNL